MPSVSVRAARRRAATAALIAAGMLLAPRPAGAAACCTSATSFGVGRLLAWESWAVGLQLEHARSLGSYDSSGALRWNGGELVEGLSRLQPWAIVRVHERVQLQAWAPFVVDERRSPDHTQVAGGLGDVGAAARFEVLGVGAYAGLPALAVTASAIAPTGRRVEETRPPLFAGTTGRGAWGGALALEAEYAFLPWFVRLDAGLTGWLPFRRADTGALQRLGPSLLVSLSAGDELVADTLVAAVAATGEWEAAPRIDGVRVPGAGARAWSLAASLSWRLDPRWTVVGTLTNGIWPDGGGVNRDARAAFTLGVRHGRL